MAPKHRDLNPSGLGRALINKKAKDTHYQQESGLFTTDVDSTSRLQSVTQERDLDEFLNVAQLAGTQFTAERRNVKIIHQVAGSTQNPFLLTDHEEKSVIKRHQDNKQRLRVPRRPAWTKDMPISRLERQEKDAFLDWRRGLAELQEQESFLLTPFERNIEVWRQLWRVLERSHLIVQIVDSRNPLRFRCEDLESYVIDIEGVEGENGTGKGMRRNLLLINKADLLTQHQRCLWADYFDEHRIQYAFYSAADAAALQQEKRDAVAALEGLESSEEDAYFSAEEDPTGEEDLRAKVLTVVELEELFLKSAPDLAAFTDSSGKPATKLVVGLVGYPNVGKSSTINSLLGEKKVSVSSTPGKTKHFQTIHLSDFIVLCDCPGLVFPQFATTKADLICDGVLPIDQMKEHTAPIALVMRRIPKSVLEAIYGLTVQVRGIEEGGDGKMTPENFLVAHAIGRGFMRAGQGNPDEARSARYVLKDYVSGKLLFANPPPGISADAFNEQTHQLALKRAQSKKHAPITRVVKGSATFVPSNIPPTSSGGNVLPVLDQGLKSQALDHDFFENNPTLSARPFVHGSAQHGQEFTRAKLFPHQNTVADDGTPLKGITFLTKSGLRTDKKHHKKGKQVKQRSGKGYD